VKTSTVKRLRNAPVSADDVITFANDSVTSGEVYYLRLPCQRLRLLQIPLFLSDRL